MAGDMMNNEASYQRSRDGMLLQSDLNEAQARRDFVRQNQFFKTQMDAQRAAIAEERRFNDPSAVVARYKNAGINPTAAFGTAGSYTPTQQAGSIPSGSVNGGSGVSLSVPPFHLDPIAGALAAAQIENIRANTRKTESETGDPDEFKRGQELTNRLTEQRVISQQTANELNALDLEFQHQVFDTNVKITKETYENLKKRNEKLQSDLWNDRLHRELTSKQIEEIDERIWYNTQMVTIAWFRANSEHELTKAQIEKIQIELPNLRATLDLLKDEHDRNAKELKILSNEVGLSDAEFYRIVGTFSYGKDGDPHDTKFSFWETVRRNFAGSFEPITRLGSALVLRNKK